MQVPLRSVFLIVAEILFLAAIVVALARLVIMPIKSVPPESVLEVPIQFEPVSFDDLIGWADDPLDGVRGTFLRSCAPLLENRGDTEYLSHPFGGTSHVLGDTPVAGTNANWLALCEQAEALSEDGDSFREFLEAEFTPVSISGEGQKTGLFTGYYEPELRGARTQIESHWVPLLPKPDDLVSIDLGLFRDDFKGNRLAGRVVSGKLKPFEDRAEIEEGALGKSAKPIVWVDDPVDAFFLHIQGSGRVELDTGEVVRVGYAGQNGHPYLAIGKVLVERGAMPLEEVSMQSIRAWLTANPEEGRDVMRQNASYIFFQELDVPDPDLGPLGAAGTNLTPGRSLAVDRKYHALGVPVWLETTLPNEETQEKKANPYNRLMVAQDTGGAIRGAVRGDVFFGAGPRATDLAGRMKQEGKMTLLLPRDLAARIEVEVAATAEMREKSP